MHTFVRMNNCSGRKKMDPTNLFSNCRSLSTFRPKFIFCNTATRSSSQSLQRKSNIKREGRKADNYGIRSNISPRLASFLHEERIFAKSKAAQACVGRLSDRIFRTTIRSQEVTVVSDIFCSNRRTTCFNISTKVLAVV